MYTLKVNASRRYCITLTDGLSEFNQAVLPYIKGNKVAVITDANVNALYGGALNEHLKNKSVYTYVVGAGETSKSKEVYFDLTERLLKDGFTRADTVIAFGGGVVGDLAGFVASTYMRGINFIQVPTTILSAVDSSVGGKTAINLDGGKNLVGCFYQPSAVYINTRFFKTLPDREIKSGFGEIVKYAFLKKTVSKQLLESGISDKLVYECLKIKRDVVGKDEKENGLRALLNLGHTVGHAIESLSGYSVSHGECVAKGLVYSLKVSKRIFNIDQTEYDRMQQILKAGGHDLSCPYTAKELAEKISYDKKGDGKTIKFIALKGIGKPVIVRLDYKTLKEYIS